MATVRATCGRLSKVPEGTIRPDLMVIVVLANVVMVFRATSHRMAEVVLRKVAPVVTALPAPAPKQMARRMIVRRSRVLNGAIMTAPRSRMVVVVTAATSAMARVLPVLRKETARTTNLPPKARFQIAQRLLRQPRLLRILRLPRYSKENFLSTPRSIEQAGMIAGLFSFGLTV